MNVWNPAGWQKIRRETAILTGEWLTYEEIEVFIDTHYLWDSSEEEISKALVEEIFQHPRNSD